MRLILVVGARPKFIRIASLLRVIDRYNALNLKSTSGMAILPRGLWRY